METPEQLVSAAASDLYAARDLLETGDALWACSAAAEAGRKALEGLVAYLGHEVGEGDLAGLAGVVAAELDATSPKLREAATTLDRYADIAERETTQPPGGAEAEAALSAARQMLELARGIIGLD